MYRSAAPKNSMTERDLLERRPAPLCLKTKPATSPLGFVARRGSAVWHECSGANRCMIMITSDRERGREDLCPRRPPEVACADLSSVLSRKSILDLIYCGFETRKQP